MTYFQYQLSGAPMANISSFSYRRFVLSATDTMTNPPYAYINNQIWDPVFEIIHPILDTITEALT